MIDGRHLLHHVSFDEFGSHCVERTKKWRAGRHDSSEAKSDQYNEKVEMCALALTMAWLRRAQWLHVPHLDRETTATAPVDNVMFEHGSAWYALGTTLNPVMDGTEVTCCVRRLRGLLR